VFSCLSVVPRDTPAKVEDRCYMFLQLRFLTVSTFKLEGLEMAVKLGQE